jgi:hypothetical protein
MYNTTNPSKEQVRAYMQLRKSAHLPPASPAEIRRQLGWSYDAQSPCFPVLYSSVLLPGKFCQLAGLLALQWLFFAVGCRS